MDALTLLNVVVAVLNITLASFQIWREYHASRRPAAHPLAPALADIAQAIREAGGQS